MIEIAVKFDRSKSPVRRLFGLAGRTSPHSFLPLYLAALFGSVIVTAAFVAESFLRDYLQVL
jgi:hypothetical protein